MVREAFDSMRAVSPASPSPPGASALAQPAAWVPRPGGRTVAAALILGSDVAAAVAALKRCFGTALPHADLLPFVGHERAALVRRLFAEVKAEAYVVADQADDPLAIARAVAAVERDGADLVVVRARLSPAFADPGAHLLRLTLGYLFGCGTGAVDAAAVVCSGRFARTYAGDGTALDLTLHALRRRMPVGEIPAPELAGALSTVPGRNRTARDWLALAGLIARLFAEERPRRTFGLAGLAAIAAGFASATPAIRTQDWHAGLLPGWDSVLPLGLTGAGVGAVAAGLLLDALAQARQDVCRIGYGAIPREPLDQTSGNLP